MSTCGQISSQAIDTPCVEQHASPRHRRHTPAPAHCPPAHCLPLTATYPRQNYNCANAPRPFSLSTIRRELTEGTTTTAQMRHTLSLSPRLGGRLLTTKPSRHHTLSLSISISLSISLYSQPAIRHSSSLLVFKDTPSYLGREC